MRTTNPTAQLEVAAAATGGLGVNMVITNVQEEINSWATLKFNLCGGATRQKSTLACISTDSWGSGDFHFLQNSVDDATNATTANSVMTVRNNGNVGIGTTSPTALGVKDKMVDPASSGMATVLNRICPPGVVGDTCQDR